MRRELDAFAYGQPLASVWPVARRLLAERGFKLVGEDRAAVGQKAQGELGRFFAKGFETRSSAGGGLSLETDENGAFLRYRLIGIDSGHGTCRIRFIAVRRRADDPTEEDRRDLDLEFELVRRVSPADASRMTEVSESAAK